MDQEIFRETMLSLKRREPFQPFVVEMEEGEQITIDDPEALAIGGEAAGFIGAQGEVYFIYGEQVRGIHQGTQEAAP